MFEEDLVVVKYAHLMELDETRDRAMKIMELHQLQTKKFFDQRATPKVFREGDVVLKWDELKSKLGKHTKFDSMWSGMFVITKCKEHNALKLSTIDGEAMPILVNGIHLKLYFLV